MVPLTGDEFLPDTLHFISPGRRVVKDTVHRQQGDYGQNLFCTVEFGGQEDCLEKSNLKCMCQVSYLLNSVSVHSLAASIKGV